MKWIFNGHEYEVDIHPLKKAKRVTVRKKASDHYAIRTPRHVPIASLKTLFHTQLELLESLPTPLNYEEYLHRDILDLWGEPTDIFKGLTSDQKRVKLDEIILEEVQFIELYFKKTQFKINLDDLTYQVKTYQSKFGSCHPKDRIIRFNRLLVHYPKKFLEYIYAHEIVHLNVPNHQPAFYQLLHEIEPEATPLKIELNHYHTAFTRG